MTPIDDIDVFEWFWNELRHHERLSTAKQVLKAGLAIFGGYDRLRGAGLIRDNIRTNEQLGEFIAVVEQHHRETQDPFPITYSGMFTDNLLHVTKFGSIVGPCKRLTKLILQVNNLRLQHEAGRSIPFLGEEAPVNRNTALHLMRTLVTQANLPELWSRPFRLFVGVPHRLYQPRLVREIIDEAIPDSLLPRLWAMRTTIEEVLPQADFLSLVEQVADWEHLGDDKVIVRFSREKSLRQQLTAIRKRVDDWLKRAGINPKW